jgi:predicted phage terminase large subunit-like protein
MAKIPAKLFEQWKKQQEFVKQYSPKETLESKEDKEKRKSVALSDFQMFVKTYFGHLCKSRGKVIPMSNFHIDAVKAVLNEPQHLFCFQWARAHAKSTVLSLFLPIYLSLIGKSKNLLLVSQSKDKAMDLLICIQAELQYNDLLIADFGDFKLQGSWEKSKFTTKLGWHCTAIGIGQDPRGAKESGNRPDFLICDDIDSSEACLSSKRLDKLFRWVREDLLGTVQPEDDYKLIMVGNRYMPDMVLTRFIELSKPYFTKVNIVDDDGNPSWPEKYSLETIEDIKKTFTNIPFRREFMNEPLIEGSIFKKEWMKYKPILPLKDYELIITYFDPSYSETGDYKAIVSVGYSNREYHILDIFLRKTTMINSVYYLFEVVKRFDAQKANYMLFMESNFAQGDNFKPIIEKIESETNTMLPIQYDESKKSDKIARIESMTPYFELGNVYWDVAQQEFPDWKLALDQLLTFSSESEHDDFCDALESAMKELGHRIRTFKPMYLSGSFDNPNKFW